MAAIANVHYKLQAEIEVKCCADKFYHMFKHEAEELPTHLPHHFQTVEVLEGDGVSVGTVKLWKYTLDGKSLYLKERMTVVDDEKRMITHSNFEGDIMKDYKRLDMGFAVNPKGGDSANGSLVTLTVDFEKANEDAPTPTAYIDFIIRVTKDVESHILNQK